MSRFPGRGDSLVRLVLVLSGLFVVGCGVTGGADDAVTGDERVAGDLDLLAELRSGLPAERSMYELRDVRCRKEENRVVVSAVLVNRLDTWWAFEPEFVVTTVDGRQIRERSLIDGMAAGEEVAVEWWFGGPDRFADPPDCRVDVLHSAFLAYQDDEMLDRIRNTLGR